MHKRDIPMSKQWYNSLYSFDKNIVRTLPMIYNHTFKLINWYLNMTNNLINTKIKSHKKIRYTSSDKLWISNPEIKHYKKKINITIYIYNSTYSFLKKKLDLFQFTWGPLLSTKGYLRDSDRLNKFKLQKRELPLYIGTSKIIHHESYYFYQKMIKWLKLNKYIYMSQYKSDILNSLGNNIKSLSKFLNNAKITNYNYLINQFEKELLYLNFRKKILFTEFKYNDLYLSYLIEILENIYKKKVELNIVSLKYFWLSTSILLQILTAKIKNKRNRGRYLLPLNYAMSKIKVPILSRNKFAGEIKSYVGTQNMKLAMFDIDEKDHLNKFLSINNKKSKIWSNKNIDELVLTNLENKIIAGVFIKIAGRLTKRYKAQRSVKKLRFKGTLKNVYSAHRNYSSSLLRGYDNINIEKKRIDSKVRIGAFGLTGWIASY